MYGMNQGYNVGDPSAQVPNHLLPHVHLVSSYRFPTLPALQPAQALEYLIKGPQIVKDTSPVAWNYFHSPPPDGTVLLTWQPPRMQTHFASDGLVWADPETAYDMNIRGYTLQALVHNSGFHYPHEPLAVHARVRYRIITGPGITDPNLWIVHYKAADPNHRIPAQQIPITRDVHMQIQMRQQLQQAGPLMRKEFMLDDRTNWPKVEFGQAAARGPQAYYNPMQPGRAYTAQPPPAKRPRLPTQQQARQPIPGAVVADTLLEEEENATQDAFDFMTARDISLSRYKQHHEWMEEIFSSPHAVGKIMPIDLGLGLMGELAPLTENILDAPGGENQMHTEGYKVKDYNKLTPEQSKDFEARVAEYTKKEQAELDRMKAAHAKKMADLKRSRTYIKAERRLRDLPRSTDADGDDADPLDRVVQDLEKSLGLTFDTKKLVVCVDKGGFIEAQQPQPQKPQVNGDGTTQSNGDGSSNGLGNEGSVDAENTAAGLLDQFGSGSLSGTPGANLSIPQMSQPPSQSQSAVATPSAPVGETAQTSSFDEQAANIDDPTGNDLLDLDVEMSGMTNTDDKTGDEWVMVEGQASTNEQQAGANNAQQPPTSTDAPTAESNVIPTSGVPGVDTDAGSMFDTADFGSFDNLDTAGDALADYTNVGDDSVGLDLMDDSAFGDAFHGTEMHHGETGGEGDNA